MQIDIDLLFKYGAHTKEFPKKEMIMKEGGGANCYHQIVSGCVKMFNINESGKEFIQGYFYAGQSFGEPPLFIDKDYPSSAIALEDCEIVRLNKNQFFKILEDYPEICRRFTALLAERIYQKTMVSKSIVNQNPEHRILSFLKSIKKETLGKKELITFTRQEIADFTGLRVETVIRSLSKAKKRNKVEIIDHKIYF